MDTQNNIFYTSQQIVVNLLSSDPQLSSIPILAENAKNIDFEIKNSLGKQGIVAVVTTPKATFVGNYSAKELAWECECEIDVVENPTVARARPGEYNVITAQDVGARAMQVLCDPKNGNSGRFSAKALEQGEENGLLVVKCMFKFLVIGGQADMPVPQPPDYRYYFPTQGIVIGQTGLNEAQLSGLLNISMPEVPQNISYFNNDSGYLNATEVQALIHEAIGDALSQEY